MISTRVMDVKLRESAEGLGEDGTGEVPLSPALGRGCFCLVGAGFCGFLHGEACSVPQCAWISPALLCLTPGRQPHHLHHLAALLCQRVGALNVLFLCLEVSMALYLTGEQRSRGSPRSTCALLSEAGGS